MEAQAHQHHLSSVHILSIASFARQTDIVTASGLPSNLLESFAQKSPHTLLVCKLFGTSLHFLFHVAQHSLVPNP